MQVKIAANFDVTQYEILMGWEYPEIVRLACQNEAKGKALEEYYKSKQT